jgi:oxygen-dependent protoporphyrinogen oxidase
MTGRRLVVVGGGITGLTLGFTLIEELRRRNLPAEVTVLEASPEVGGHARTIVDDGFLVEGGPNGFLDREPETMALVEEAELSSRLVEARPEAKRRFIVRGGRLRQVPESPPALITSDALSWRGKLRLALEPLAPGPPPGVDETVYEFSRRRIGREAAEMLVDAAVSGISAGDSRALSVRAQFPMMIEMEREHGSLVRAMIARRRRGIGPSRLLSFDGGLATLTRGLATRIGSALRTGADVRALVPDGASWRIVLGDGSTLDADRVLLALPARASAGLVQDFDAELASRLRHIVYSGVSLVALAYRCADVPRPLDGYGYLVTRGEGLATLGVVWESSLFPGRAPADMALLRVFLGGARQPGVVEQPNGAAVNLARRELQQVMGITAAPAKTWTFRWPHAIAQYTVGHVERAEGIRERARQHKGLHVCGTSYDGVSFNHAIASARKAAFRLVNSEL